MQNTIRYALFLLIVSGILFTACESAAEDSDSILPSDEAVVEEEEAVEESAIETDLDEDTEKSPAADEDKSPATTTNPGITTQPSEPAEESSVYEDGTYTASGTYTSPAGPESIAVTVTVKNDLVSSVSIGQNATNPTSINFQGLFAAGISGQVVGKSLDEIGNYSSVNGSSLTPNAFDLALASIKAQAAL